MSQHSNFNIGIIGGGISGATAALYLSQLGAQVHLFEQGPELVNGPPFCHIHAGGNFYREISDQHCLTLLEQSIQTMRLYPQAVIRRPTVIAIPQQDAGEPSALLARLNKVSQHYQHLVEEDEANLVLGPVDQYFQLYDQAQMQALTLQSPKSQPKTADDWMIPVARQLDLSQIKYPIIQVQELGMSLFRASAINQWLLTKQDNCTLHMDCKIDQVVANEQGYMLSCLDSGSQSVQQIEVDFVVNAAGFQTGEIDETLHIARSRLAEFKASYLTHWPVAATPWPELLIHGDRDTPNGMAQLTPYPNGYFQLHGMTSDITLFKDGLVEAAENEAQPHFTAEFDERLKRNWNTPEVTERSAAAIAHAARLVPEFSQAQPIGKALWGAQQIPGHEASLRAADVSFNGKRYARMEIVKASSAYAASQKIAQHCIDQGWLNPVELPLDQITHQATADKVLLHAQQIAKQRGYPADIA